MGESNFQGADFTNADLRGADLSQADLTDAIIDGANFQDAILFDAKTRTLDAAKAKNLDLQKSTPRKAGPNLRELEKAAKKASRITTTLDIATKQGEIQLHADCGKSWGYFMAQHANQRTAYASGVTPRQGMLGLAARFPGATLRFDSLTVKSTKSPVQGKQLRELALGAWCEAFGVQPPSDDELKQQKQSRKAQQQEVREKLLADLRGGAAGVKRFNEAAEADLQSAGDFRQVDLSGAKLAGVRFRSLDFQGANFQCAKLSKASSDYDANFKNANFQQADLRQAQMKGVCEGANFEQAVLAKANFCSLRKANLRGVDLRSADLRNCLLQGADFTGADLGGAQLKNAHYDEGTRLPEGFTPPKEMIWDGAGVPPSQRTLQEVKGPLDLETFMARLKEITDAARLAKTLKMLKAGSFRLFAEVDDAQLVGVVKSQTDAELVYSCRLASDGSFSCCTQNLNVCGGLRVRCASTFWCWSSG